jgi:hypothetical protein
VRGLGFVATGGGGRPTLREVGEGGGVRGVDCRVEVSRRGGRGGTGGACLGVYAGESNIPRRISEVKDGSGP